MHCKGYLILLLASLALSPAPERIAWSENRKLEWSDFKGSPNTDEGWGASTASGMSQVYTVDGRGFLNKNKVTVTAHFYPEYSWVRHREKTAHLLGHEQTHFDITEYHARLLQSRLEAYDFTSNSKVEVKQKYDEIENQRIAMQQLFDAETEHSINHTTEIQWEFKMARLLRDTQKK